ncbi:HAD family phosphatase [Candidatus Woesearchaeota archaeon]|nr:HAD family phosphatase [Candidatus Woesearchaeota archaeon]
MIKGLLFDMDGVIIDSERYNDKSCEELLASFGKPYDRDYLKPLMTGKSDVEGMEILAKHHNLPISGAEFNRIRLETKEKAYESHIPFVDGFENFFKKIVDYFNCPKCIVTAANENFVNHIDKRLGIGKLFDNNLFRSDMVEHHKPAPDPYIYGAKQLGVDCKDCLVFEDSPSGIVSGCRAGSRVIAITTTFSKEVILNNIEKIDRSVNVNNILFIDDFSDESLTKVIKFAETTNS